MKQFRIVLWVLVAVAFAGFVVLNLPKGSTDSVVSPIGGFNKGQHFTLTDHTGKIFDSKNALADGHYALLFFGFTHCPVICPTELQKFTEVMDGLPKGTAEKIIPLFITVDPERDTSAVLADYVPAFHPSIIGLTGNVDTVHKVLSDWKVYYSKVEDPQFADYTMDHSTYAYVVDADMNILALFSMKATAEDIIKRLSVIAAPNN